MPLIYEIIESKKLVYVIGTGAVTFYELMHHIEELCLDPKYKAPMKKLIDYRQIKYLDLSMQEQEVFAQKKKRSQCVICRRKMCYCCTHGCWIWNSTGAWRAHRRFDDRYDGI